MPPFLKEKFADEIYIHAESKNEESKDGDDFKVVRMFEQENEAIYFSIVNKQ